MKNILWKISNSVLTISGSGKMSNYKTSSSPWSFCSKAISTVIIENGITSIGSLAFSGCSSLNSITIPSSVISISLLAFSNCRSLKSVIILNSEGFIKIHFNAFNGCPITSFTFIAK